MNKIQNVTNFYVLCNKLKDLIRKGPIVWNVQRDRLESVAEHIYKTQMLAIAMYSEFDYDIDIGKVIYMIAIHELGEIVIGDISALDKGQEDSNKEKESVHKILNAIFEEKETENIYNEFTERKTKEAFFAYQCDKLECDLQSKLYDQENCVDLNNQPNNKYMQNEIVKSLFDKGYSFSEMWILYGQKFYPYDDYFLKVSNYALNNKINSDRKENMLPEEKVINFYILCTSLKDIIRTGWLNWNVQRERIESVADHIYSSQMLALAVKYVFNYDIDIKKIIMMLSLHELDEIVIGDIAMSDPNYLSKKIGSKDAVKEVLSCLKKQKELAELVYEFEERKTKEALFAFHCDKLECDLQAKLYDEENCVDINNQHNNKYTSSEIDLIKKGITSFSKLWLLTDKYLYEDDDIFMSILDYANDNKLALKKKFYN